VVATALAQQHGVAAARDKHLDAIAAETRALLSKATATRLCAVPVGVMKGDAPALVIAMRDPGDAAAIEALARETGYPVRAAVACEARLLEVIEAWPDETAGPSSPPRAARVSSPPPRIEMLTPPPMPLEAIDRAVAAAMAAGDIDGALDVPDAFGPPPTFERALPTPVATGLELADVPRRRVASTSPPTSPGGPVRPPGMSPPSSAIRVGAAAPVGAALLDEPPTAGGASRWIGRGVGVAVAAAVVAVTYSYCRDDGASGGPITGAEVHGTFHSDRLDASLRLPGFGWREVPAGIDGVMAQLGDHSRADFFVRGDDAAHPDSAAIVFRVTQPGAFPAQVDPAQIRAGLDAMQARAVSLSNGMFTVTGLTCDVTTLRERPLGACAGESTLLGASYRLQIFMWIPSTDDAIATLWFDKDGTRNPRTLVDSFRTD
jgi:hypothetical protein